MTEITTIQSRGPMCQRWFGITLTLSLMLIGSALFAAGISSSLSLADRFQVILSVMRGPFGLHGGQIFTLQSPGWMIWIVLTVVLFPLHLLRPSGATLFGTLVGGLLWWFTGVLVVGAGC